MCEGSGHLSKWVILCIPMGGHAERLTNLPHSPQLSFCVCNSAKGCVQNGQFIFTACLLMGVSLKSMKTIRLNATVK